MTIVKMTKGSGRRSRIPPGMIRCLGTYRALYKPSGILPSKGSTPDRRPSCLFGTGMEAFERPGKTRKNFSLLHKGQAIPEQEGLRMVDRWRIAKPSMRCL